MPVCTLGNWRVSALLGARRQVAAAWYWQIAGVPDRPDCWPGLTQSKARGFRKQKKRASPVFRAKRGRPGLEENGGHHPETLDGNSRPLCGDPFAVGACFYRRGRARAAGRCPGNHAIRPRVGQLCRGSLRRSAATDIVRQRTKQDRRTSRLALGRPVFCKFAVCKVAGADQRAASAVQQASADLVLLERDPASRRRPARLDSSWPSETGRKFQASTPTSY